MYVGDTNNGKLKRIITSNLFGLTEQDFIKKVVEWYTVNKMSSQEIVDLIKNSVDIQYTPRSIQRIIQKYSEPRSRKEAFNNAIQRGRVQWVYKNLKYKWKKLNLKLRLQILQKDNYKCVLCGNTAKESILEVDHIIPLYQGGLSIPDNLQTLCYDCNKGKQILNKER